MLFSWLTNVDPRPFRFAADIVSIRNAIRFMSGSNKYIAYLIHEHPTEDKSTTLSVEDSKFNSSKEFYQLAMPSWFFNELEELNANSIHPDNKLFEVVRSQVIIESNNLQKKC